MDRQDTCYIVGKTENQFQVFNAQQFKDLTVESQDSSCKLKIDQNSQIKRDILKKNEDVEEAPTREIKQYVDQAQPNVPQKIVPRKLSKRVVFISKTIDFAVSAASVITSAVCGIKSMLHQGEDDAALAYQKQLVMTTAIVGAVCGCVGTIKSKILDGLKSCATEYNAEQPVIIQTIVK